MGASIKTSIGASIGASIGTSTGITIEWNIPQICWDGYWFLI